MLGCRFKTILNFFPFCQNTVSYSMSYLHIAQKNSIAKQISNVLSNGNKRTGFTLSQYNPVFQFSLDGEQHVFSSVRGHIFDYELPPECKSWIQYDNKKILTQEVLMVKKLGPQMEGLAKNIQNLAQKCKHLILWLDCDREGEAIAYEVIQLAKLSNPHVRIKRARFSAVTRTDVMNAYNNLVEPNQREADAVNYRIEVDFRLGCTFTRYQTIVFSKYYKLLDSQYMSYGPCQIPTLGFVVERYLQIKHFQSQFYYYLTAKAILDQKTAVQFKWQEQNTKTQQDIMNRYLSMYQKAEDPNVQGRILGKVQDRKEKEKKKYRPYPLTTINFQKLATSKLKMSSADAMGLAEKLYQKGFISYPRTETNSFPTTYNIPSMIKRLENIPTYKDFIHKLLNENKYLKPKVGKDNDQAHSPIHPVKLAHSEDLSTDQWKIYDLISRHFLACCSADAIGIQSEVLVIIGEEKFRASHLRIKEGNYLEIYPYESWFESSFPGKIPDTFEAFINYQENKTKPPGYLSESDLIDKMEKNQIGTDSTIHEHIETIQKRNYAVKSENTFKPTNLGASLVTTYKNLGIKLSQCQIRRVIEHNMNDISIGKISRTEATTETLKSMVPIYEKLMGMQTQWLNEMKNAISTHPTLKNVVISNAEYERNGGDHSRRENNQTNYTSNRGGSDDSDSNSNSNGYKCFKCGQPGHIAPNCPNPTNSSYKSNHPNNTSYKTNTSNPTKSYNNTNQQKPSAIICFTCKEPGHVSTNCPSSSPTKNYNKTNQQKPNAIICYTCKEPGHVSTNCPSSENKQHSNSHSNQNSYENRNQNKLQDIKCYKCEQLGHYSKDCPQGQMANNKSYQNKSYNPNNNYNKGTENSHQNRQVKGNNNSKYTCYICKQAGHVATNCPSKNASGHSVEPVGRQATNYNSNNDFKPSFESNSHQTKPSGDLSKFTCFICKQPGHLAPQCPTKKPSSNQASYQTSYQTVKTKVNISSALESTVKEKKVCPVCNVEGRHPKNSNCPNIKRAKKKEERSDDDENSEY